MLAMTAKNDLGGSREPLEESAVEHPSTMRRNEERGHVRFHSGLSALIQAATSQLGNLADAAGAMGEGGERDIIHHHDKPRSRLDSEDKSCSDESEHLVLNQARTPTMIPEPDPTKQSFPELLMTLAVEPSNEDIIAFLPDGKFFAIRSKDFVQKIMIHYFAVTTFEAFLELSNDWGFSRILQDPNATGIEVFRHPKFIRGDWAMCARIKFGESPTEVRLSALPAGIEYTLSEESNNTSSSAQSKRRLSPGFLARRESESSISSQKMKTDQSSSRRESITSEGGEDLVAQGHPPFHFVNRSDELRSIALAITTEKLNIKSDSRDGKDTASSAPLIDRAVQSATHTIVTDAIESLLRDKSHSKRTYLKHEKELSKSLIPGVIPISKQLFSTDNESVAATPCQTPPLSQIPDDTSRLSDERGCPMSSEKMSPCVVTVEEPTRKSPDPADSTS